jgi:ABC-type lipoprotein export system ATPase subunit
VKPSSGAAEALAACKELSIVYGHGDSEVVALDHVTLVVEPGDSVALLGRSGSGKTTLLHALGGLVEPTNGTVEWREDSLPSLDEGARRALRARGISYVFQGANLLPFFTAFENVAFAARVSGGEADPALAPLALLELVGLHDKIDHLPAELSGGEAQRVSIARALAQGPELLLCDEPTGHLDSDTAERVLELAEALQDQFRFALVVATHDPGVAARFPRAVELHDGRVVLDQMIA